ncbi:hypothetical protein F7725_015967 [Dissostichus mawsoni]|uniref:IRS-type PTB domain-containing protein n=1 Tax=Dissostichus mawsoni TaxID=36200 RepID=A0A7J5Y554_DISMA|nr:hypothetical protein F7725_015967 [Dissostichus mawsoni]
MSLLVYKEKKKKKGKRENGSGHKERLNVTLEGICGVEPGPGYDGVCYSLSVLCLAQTLVLGFNSREAMLAWDTRIRYSLGEVHRLCVNVEPGTKLESGPASLHLCNDLLVLTRGVPPVVIGHWKLSALRRYGAVPNGFVFEGGTRCGYWAGVFFLSCSEGEQISFLFDCIVRGITPSRTPHGLRPVLPDLNADPASAEERLSLEASELEKRLSMLSQCSLASSTASTYSCSTSVAGDDQSSISSSSSSQSDTSYGSRLSFRAEPLARPHISTDTASSCSTLKARSGSDDRLFAAVMGSSGPRPPSAQLHLRSSLDSGIGVAAGSQSSYSGSYSSYTGSLDMASQGGEGEFGSVGSLPAHLPSSPTPHPPSSPPPYLPSSPPPPPPISLPPSSPFQTTLTPEPASSSSCPFTSRSSSRASQGHSEDYQIPSLLRLWYDTPRSLLQSLSLREPPLQQGPPELGRDSRRGVEARGSQGQRLTNSPPGSRAQRQAMMQRSFLGQREGAPCGGGGGVYTETPAAAWRLLRSWFGQLHYTRAVAFSEEQMLESDHPLCVREEQDDVGDKCEGPRRPGSSRPPSAPPPPPVALRPTSAWGMIQSAHQAPPSVSLESWHHIDSTVNYVNIPISPLPAHTNRELLYTELDLQDPHSAVREEGSIRYAHLDIAAMETAQRVGAEHVQGREDRLSQLERRRGPPN